MPSESNFVTCACQYCNGHISFDAAGFQKDEARTIECPHCHLETIIFARPAQKPPSAQAQAVKGTILDFAVQTNAGIISGDDGQRYSFQGAEWRETGKYPAKGMRVDFSPQAGNASAIYLIQDVPGAASGNAEKRDCNHLVAGLLGIFLGCLGIHKFYMGQTQAGSLYIVAGVVTCGFGFGITWIIGLVEGIIYLSMTQAEFERKYILNPPKSLTPAEGIGKIITLPPKKRFLWLIAIFAGIFIIMWLYEMTHGFFAGH